MKSWQFIAEIYRKFPGLLIQCVLWQVGVGMVTAFSLLTVSPLVDFFIDPHLTNVSPLTHKTAGILQTLGLPVSLASLVAIFMILILTSTVFQIVARYWILNIVYAIVRELTIGAFEDFFNARWFFFSSRRQGALINTFNHEMTIVSNAISAMSQFFSALIQAAFFLSVPFLISWSVTLISLLTGVILSIPLSFLGKISYRWGQVKTETAVKSTSMIQECLSLAKVLLGFGNQKESLVVLGEYFDAHARVSILSQTLNTAILTLYRPFGVIMVIVALFSARSFSVPLSEMMVLILSLFQVAQSLGNISEKKNSLDNFLPSYEHIKQLRKEAREQPQVQGNRIFNGFEQLIEVRNLTFAYPQHDPVLKNITMIIPKGKMIAIAGRSGAGKSTLIDMIMGFHEPQQGAVLFDGVRLQEFEMNTFRRRIGYVPQESALFHMSIRDNLLWANSNAGDEDIRAACRMAFADEFIESFPDKYQTIVGDRGVRLSGGQLQRVALARALLRKPELLILDEATSSLDSHSERLIQQALENVAQATTVVVIAHRLSTIKKADQIYVLDNGEVVESGSYNELVGKLGAFSKLAQLQELTV